ncbi:MAG: sugar porter family MFS transporter [Phycisphaerales bacterium JB063]
MSIDGSDQAAPWLVSRLGPRAFLAFVCAAAAVGGLLFGFDTAVISGTVSLVEAQYALSGLQVGWFGSSALMGCIPGALIAGWAGDRLGRKPVMLLAGLLFFVSALGSMLPPSFAWLIVARWVGGVGVGLASVIAPIFISEFAPPKQRGRLVALYQLSIVIGVLAAYFTNWLLIRNAASLPVDAQGMLHTVMGPEVWRAMFGAEMLPAALFLGLLLLVPESPRYLVRRGRLAQASQILRKVMGDDEAGTGLAAIQRTQQARQVPWSELLGPGVRKMLMVAVALSFFGQLSGVNIVIYYGPRILEGAGLAVESAMLYQVLLGVINLVFTVAAMVLIDRVGRRPLLVGGMAVVALSLLVAGGLFLLPSPPSVLIVIVLSLYIACIALSICAVIWVLTPEVLPNRVRERGMAVAVFVNWSTNAVSALLFPWYTSKLGMAAGFLTFGVVCVFSTYFFFRWVPETAGRSLEEIEDEHTQPDGPPALASAGAV